MNNDEILALVDLLYRATKEQKLQWESALVYNQSGYRTVIDNCTVSFAIYYDPIEHFSVAAVDLRNRNNVSFFKFTFPQPDYTEIYMSIDNLMNLINDQVYLITESKKQIFNKLNDMLKYF